MILKLVSNSNVDNFNQQVESIINEYENQNFILANVDFKVTANHYSVLLFFVNPYKEQTKLSSVINTIPNAFQL